MDALSKQRWQSLVTLVGKQTRRVQRGSFGRTRGRSTYPAMGVSHELRRMAEAVHHNPYCNPEALQDLEPEVEEELKRRNVPEGARCRVSMDLIAQQRARTQKHRDRRRIRLPKYDSGDTDSVYAALNRTEKAKKHLDRARQMYWFGIGLYQRALRESGRARGAAPGSPEALRLQRTVQTELKKADLLIGTTGHDRRGKTSALREFLKAYQLIRDYEMNPQKPLLKNGTPNEARVKEDKAYVFIMGTHRLQPNRLGVDATTRRVWRERGIQDPNHYTATNEGPDSLYQNVNPHDYRGPMLVQAYEDWLQQRGRHGQRPSVNELREAGCAPRRVCTDMSRALANAHFNLPVPDIVVTDETTDATVAPRMLRRAPYAQPDSDPKAVYFPSGRLQRRVGGKPEYVQIPPDPAHGVPPSDGDVWDGRVAVNMLRNERSQLAREVMSLRPEEDTLWRSGPRAVRESAIERLN